MTLFIIYLICCLGITYAWSDTEVSVPFRNIIAKIPFLRKPLLCHECSSFWISFGLSFVLNPIEEYTIKFASNILLAFCGFFVNLVFVRNKLVAYRQYE